MHTIGTEELRSLLETGEAAVFDVRGDVEFEYGHIPGTMSAPLGSLVFRVVRTMFPDSFVGVYSYGGDCTLASEAVERLENLGMRNVHLYAEGLAGWRAAGHEAPESKSPKLHTRGEVHECRPVIVDRENSYGGAFREKTMSTEGAGG